MSLLIPELIMVTRRGNPEVLQQHLYSQQFPRGVHFCLLRKLCIGARDYVDIPRSPSLKVILKDPRCSHSALLAGVTTCEPSNKQGSGPHLGHVGLLCSVQCSHISHWDGHTWRLSEQNACIGFLTCGVRHCREKRPNRIL